MMNIDVMCNVRTTAVFPLKVMPPILWCCPTISEVDVGGMAVEVEPSYQYSIIFCCYVTDGSRGAAWQNGIWHGSAYKSVKLNSSMWKKWHPLTFTDACWTFMETKQWMWAQWGVGVHFSSGDSDSGSPPLLQIFTSPACRLLFIAGENAELMVVAVLKMSVL